MGGCKWVFLQFLYLVPPPCILTIAGSDSGGGAGIQADLKVATVLGGFGMSVITALTAQNGLGVTGIHAPEAAFVVKQLEAVLTGFPVAGAKTGMLFSAQIIEGVATVLQEKNFPLVVDPVCISTSGHRLLQEDAVDALKTYMLPLADLLTPNRHEAEYLANMSIDSEADVDQAGQRLLALGAKAVLIKGGHFDAAEGDAKSAMLVDWLIRPETAPLPLPVKKIETSHIHGTGCALSAAIATYLGHGLALDEAVEQAQKYLNYCLRHGYAPGQGFGPPNHAAPWLVNS